jgi:hypothetical protein
MSQLNYVISTTELSLTASGTTVGSGNTQSGAFVVARTMVRTGLSAGELLSGSRTWSIIYEVSAMSTPYEMRLKIQRLNSGGTVQSESGYGTTRTSTGEYQDDLTWDSDTWSEDDQLALVWEHRRPSGTGNKNGTIVANGVSYIDAPAPDNQVVNPGVGALSLAGFVASVVATANQVVNAGVGALLITGFAPTVSVNPVGGSHEALPGTGEIVVEGHAPSASVTNNQVIFPGAGELVLGGFTSVVQTPREVLPSTGELTLDGYFASVETPRNISPDVGELTLLGFSPSLGSPVEVLPGVGVLLITGYSPTIQANVGAEPPTGELNLSGHSPAVGENVQALSETGELIINGFSPTVQIPNNVLAGAGELILTGFPPSVETTSEADFTPGTGDLLVNGFSPTISGGGGIDGITYTPKSTLVTVTATNKDSEKSVEYIEMKPKVTVSKTFL